MAVETNRPMVEKTELVRLQQLVTRASSGWTGCNWQTAFGPRQLNLAGIRAYQAQVIAEATPGEESQAWADAARWLRVVEHDAKLAATHGKQALQFASSGDALAARTQIVFAIGLEAKYRSPIAWPAVWSALADQ